MNAQSRQMSPSLLWRERMVVDPAVKMIIAHTITKVSLFIYKGQVHIKFILSCHTVIYHSTKPCPAGA